MRRAHPRRRLSVAAGLVAASAWYGAAGLGVGFLELPDRLVRRLPFGSPVFAGVALAVVVALPYSALAVVARRGDRRTQPVSFGCGLVLMGWIAVELLAVREFSFLQPLMAGVGMAFVLTGRPGGPGRGGARTTPLARLAVLVREHPVPAFFALAITLSWSYWVPDALAGGHWTTTPGFSAPRSRRS